MVVVVVVVVSVVVVMVVVVLVLVVSVVVVRVVVPVVATVVVVGARRRSRVRRGLRMRIGHGCRCGPLTTGRRGRPLARGRDDDGSGHRWM